MTLSCLPRKGSRTFICFQMDYNFFVMSFYSWNWIEDEDGRIYKKEFIGFKIFISDRVRLK